MNKKSTLPISATVAYDKKSDTVVLTSADQKLEGSRFRVALKKDTVEDLKLRQLLTAAAADAGVQDELPPYVIPDIHIPVPITGLNGLIPLGTSYDGQQVHWNTSRHPHALIVAEDPHERAAFTEMLLAAVRTQEDWIYFPISTGKTASVFGGFEHLEDEYLNARYEQMRKEGVVWYSDSSKDYKKVLVVLEAADTLLPAQERLLNRILTLGPATGITVVAISASQPDWQTRTLQNFNLSLAVMDYEEGAYSRNNGRELFDTHRKLGFSITGSHASVLKVKDAYNPVRFYGMPE